MKRFLVILFTVCATGAPWAYKVTVNGMTYSIFNDEAAITHCR